MDDDGRGMGTKMRNGFFLGMAIAAASCSRPAGDWDSLKRDIRSRYPEARQISAEELSGWMQREDAPILLDARAPEEFAVSHLKGATRAPDLKTALERLSGVPKDRGIVVYCSVGYRSSALAEKLRRHGYTSAFNLEGSIFEWANDGRPVYRGDETLREVHPFDGEWGRFLDEPLRASVVP